MQETSDIKIISMLGEVNGKINDIAIMLENIQDRMNKNFRVLAENQISTTDKLNELGDDIREIKFKVGVLESGVGLNASKIGELSKRGTI